MLKDASIAGTPAPASLSGGAPLGDEGGWIKRRSQSINGSTSPKTFLETSDQLSSARRSIDSAISATSSRSTVPRSRTPDGTSLSARHRSSTLKLNPSTARPVTAKDNLTVSSRGASSLKATATSDSSPIETDSLASRLTVSSLLDQLTEIHDRQQKERMVEWDAFLRKRQNTRKGQGMGLIGISQMGLAGKAGQEEFKAFSRLVRGGIPLSYRSDVWAGEFCHIAQSQWLMGSLKNVRVQRTPWYRESTRRSWPSTRMIGVRSLRRSRRTCREPSPGMSFSVRSQHRRAAISLTAE